MDALRHKPFVRESDVFSALFPRAFTPQNADTLPRLLHHAKDDATRHGATTNNSESTDTKGDGNAMQSARAPKKLGMLSPKTPRSLMASPPMSATDCAVVWKFLCDWITAQLAMEAPAAIPGFGTITMRTQAPKIRMSFFEPDRQFMERHSLRLVDAKEPKSASLLPSSGAATTSAVLSFNYLEMAACCGKHVEPSKAKEWLETVVHRFGDAMRHCQRVEFGLGVGVVVCVNRTIESHMLPPHSSAPPSIPYEVRTGESVVKRSLMATACSPKSKQATSFLTGANFSSGIRLHPAMEADRDAMSELFTLDTASASSRFNHHQPRSLIAVVPGGATPKALSGSPRTQRLKKQPHGTNSSQPQQMSTAAKYPALFDLISRTYCVEPDMNLSFLQPSNRIASNYTPASAGLRMVMSSTSSGSGGSGVLSLAFTEETLPCDSAFGVVDLKRHRGIDDHDTDGAASDHAVSEERYFAYLSDANRLMDAKWLAPLDPALVERIVTSAVKYLNAIPTGHMKTVLDAAQEEFVANYNISVKKAIMDYLLVRHATRLRLGILHGTPSHTKLPHRWQWGDSKGANGCMQDLKSLVASSLLRASCDPQPHSPTKSKPTSRFHPHGSSSSTQPMESESSLAIKKRRRKRIKIRLQATFMLANPQVRALHYMWYDFQATISLVKLPDASSRLNGKMEPLDLHLFEKEQLAHAYQMKTYLMEHWYHRTKQLFEQVMVKSPNEMTIVEIAKLKHLFDAVAVQMSQQIRALILKSIRAYAEYFTRFGNAKASSQSMADDTVNTSHPHTGSPSALLVSLILKDGNIQFKTPLMEIPSMLLGVLHNLPQLFHNMSRIETQFEKPLTSLFTSLTSTSTAPPTIGNTSVAHYSPFLWNVRSQEDEIVAATFRIREVIEQNMAQLHHLQADYALYGATFRQITSGASDIENESSVDGGGIDEWQKKLQKVRDVATALAKTTRSCCQLNLFSVNCEQVNRALLLAFSQYTNRLLTGFADRTAACNAQLRQQYKDVAARLAKRPMDLYDLVEAEEFVDLLKKKTLEELQIRVDDIKERMQFLLFHREAGHIDGPDTLASEPTQARKGGVKSLPAAATATIKPFRVSQELLASTAKTIRWRVHINRLLQDAEASLVGERARIEAVFLAKRNRFQSEMEEFDAEVKSFSKKGDLRHAATYVVQLAKMKEALVGFKRQMDAIAQEEAKLQWKPTDFSKLDDIAEEMEPYEQLWKTAREFRELNAKWLRTNVFELHAHDGLKALQSMMVTISNVSNLLHLNSASAAITAEMIKKQMSDFRENAKLVAAILNPSVQERHLKEMSLLVALTIDPREPITLLKLLENGAYDHLPRVVEISENATMEKQVEDALRAIHDEWQDVQFRFKEKAPFTASSLPGDETDPIQLVSAQPAQLVKASIEDIKLLIDDHQLRLQTLQCLPHAVAFAHEISQWLLFLHDLFLVADLSVVNERMWKRIAPLFTAKIIDDTTDDATLFYQADALYRSTASRIARQPVCIELVPPRGSEHTNTVDLFVVKTSDNPLGLHHSAGDRNGSSTGLLLFELRTCCELLERVKDNISVGFELRRAQFPRFYLLSDSELVAVLTIHRPSTNAPTTKACEPPPKKAAMEDPHGVSSPALWKFLRFCFPGMRRVQMNPQQELTAFISAHGEQVPIGSPIQTSNTPIATWLTKLEASMVTILQACIRAAISDFARKEFRKWCLLWPEQVLCATIQYAWTMQGEINNKKPSLSESKNAWQAEIQVLHDRAEAVARELKAAPTPSVRLTLSNVILLLHQLRDVSMQIRDELAALPDFQETVSEEETIVSQSSAAPSPPNGPPPDTMANRETMTWLAQPRLYYDSNAALGVKLMAFTPIPYGFEYVGNVSPAVCITPLTLRCFHTLALHASMLNKGSLLSGPAGTGKKTTCAALARLCGRLLIQFDHQDHLNASPSQRFQELVQFIKGSVSCGAWLMITGIEHLQPAKYLSLLASMCLQIFDSHAAKHTQCTVLGTKLKMKRGIHFVVVCPSSTLHAPLTSVTTRKPSPEYLRSFFRPVEVQVHDIDLLTEFFLEQNKMMHTKALAKFINSVTRVVKGGMDLLDSHEVLALRESLSNARALRRIATRSAALCAQERHAICAAHGWPPQVAPPTLVVSVSSHGTPLPPTEKEIPVELVREIESMEHKAVCLTLREVVGSLAPANKMEWIDFVLRDFVSTSRELRVMKSFLLPTFATSRDHTGGTGKVTKEGPFKVDDAINSFVCTAAELSLGWEPPSQTLAAAGQRSAFSQKTLQLYHTLQSHRTVVVVGGIQTGKSTLWQTLATAATELKSHHDTSGHGHGHDRATVTATASVKKLDDLLRPTRTVVLHPGALTLAQLFGSSSPSEEIHASVDTVITRLNRGAKKHKRNLGEEDQTWLILDGDLCESWAERMLQVAEEKDVDPSDSCSRLPGLLLPSGGGKRVVMPPNMRVIVETTTLKDISPAYLSRVGVVHAGGMLDEEDNRHVTRNGNCHSLLWRRYYRAWKHHHGPIFAALREELFSLLDVLLDETMDSCLDFVTTNFHNKDRFPTTLLVAWRVRGFLALLHSFLHQSWAKMSAMVSGKQRKTAIHCYFLQALVWGVGHTSDASERLKFHVFLRELIINGPRSADSSLKRVLILFFPSGTLGSVAAGLRGLGATQRSLDLAGGGGSGAAAAAAANKETLYSFSFSVELGSKWTRWPEFYDSWIMDRCQLFGGETLAPGLGKRGGGKGTQQSAHPSESDPSSPGDSLMTAASGSRHSNLLFVRTSNMSAAVYLLHQLMATGYTGLLCGPRDSGKTTCGRAWMDLHAFFAQLQNAGGGGSPSEDDGNNNERQDTMTQTPSEHVYIGPSATARHVLEQLATFIEQKRVRSRRPRLHTPNATHAPFKITSSMLVFVDDLHAVDPHQPSDSALELLRGLLERQQLVHPTVNTMMACDHGLAPFATMQTDRGGQCVIDRELQRVVARFIPVGLPPSTDTDLSSICSAFVSTMEHVSATTGGTASHAAHTTAATSDLSYNPVIQEASQLVAMLIKATIKMFRILSSDHWSLTPSSHFHVGRDYAATIAFQPAKAQYLFHSHDIFRVLHSVCGEAKQTLSMAEKLPIAKLWCHETARVFGDRLSDASDVQTFYQLLHEISCSHFALPQDAFMNSSSAQLQQHQQSETSAVTAASAMWLKDQLQYSFIGESSGAGMVDGYREVQELHKVELSIERTMAAMYRANIVTESMPFVLCSFAIRHILRLTRVLRLGDQHLLLIGNRDSKMRTLTRLAACICRKKTITYYVPKRQTTTQDTTEGTASTTTRKTWTEALKAALLQCVRQPRDEKLVFIVKDMWLEDLEIYAPLDRYLSGGKLLSDVISYEDFDEVVLQTLRDEAERDRKAEGSASNNNNSNTEGAGTAVLMHSKCSVVEYFFTLVRRKLQIVLIFALPPPADHATAPSAPSSSAVKLAQLMWRYPHLQKTCTKNVFDEWPEESLHVIAQKSFAPLFGTDRERLLQLSQVAVQMYQRTRVALAAKGEPRADGKGSVRPTTGDAKAGGPLATMGLAPSDLAGPLIQLDISMLVEQICLFLSHWPRLQQDVEANKAKYTSGLEFMERTEQILALEQSQQQRLQPEMDKKSALTRRMSGDMEKEKLMTTKLTRAFEMETLLVDTQRKRLAQVEKEYDELIKETRAVFEERTKTMTLFPVAMGTGTGTDGSRDGASSRSSSPSRPVTAETPSEAATGTMTATTTEEKPATPGKLAEDAPLDRKEAFARRQRRSLVSSFAALPHPATSLRQLAECIGVIFGIEPVESRDELDPDEIVMDYWGSMTSRMGNVDFWQELVEFDVPKRMTEAIVARVLPICSAPDFDKALFVGIHELAVLLCEWVQSCVQYARDFVLAAPKYAQLCQERLACEAATQQLRARQAEIYQQSATTSNVTALRTLTEQQRHEIEAKLKDNTSTLQMTSSVWKVLQPCKTKWRKWYEYYTQLSVQAMGDLMLATANMAYTSSMTSRVRSKLRGLWSEELHKHYVVHSLPAVDAVRSLRDVFLVDERTLTKWQIDGLPRQDASCVESAVMVAQSFLFPVLIDPHRVASAWLKRQCANSSSHDGEEERADTGVIALKGATHEQSDTLWDAITQSIKKKRPLIVDDFNENHAVELLSLLQCKKRSRFDTVNRDVSSVTSGAGIGASSPSSARQRSSIAIGLGANEATNGMGPGFGVHENRRCWFELSANASESKLRADKATIVECGSQSCRGYFIYSESETIPPWLASLASHVALIRFEFSTSHVQAKALRVVLDSHSSMRSHVLTQIQTLQFDMISCDEQIETIENEVLDFFSVEDPISVYGDTSKALKIVGNRSALHTLETSKLDSSKKIQHHYLRLSSYDGLIQRSLDLVRTWRDVSAMCDSSPATKMPAFPVEWIWMCLTEALHRSDLWTTSEDQVGMFTTQLRQTIEAAYTGSDVPLLFDILLSLRVHHHRRRHQKLAPPPGQEAVDEEGPICDGQGSEEPYDDDSVIPEIADVLPRVVQMLECKDETQVKSLCGSVSSKLLSARPSDLIPVHKWRAVCFFAEKHLPLRDLVTSHSQYAGGKDAWKAAMALDQLLTISKDNVLWTPTIEVDAVSRICLLAAWQKSSFLREIEAFTSHELAWSPSMSPVRKADESSAAVAEQATVVSDGDQRGPVGDVVDLVAREMAPASPAKTAPPMLPHESTWNNLCSVYSTMTTPIVILCRPELKLYHEAMKAAEQAKATLDMTTHESPCDETFEKNLLTAIRKGDWVVLPHIETHASWIPIIIRLITRIRNHEPHSDFRLWMSTLAPTVSLKPTTTLRYTNNNHFALSSALRRALSLMDHQPRHRQQQPHRSRQHEAASAVAATTRSLVATRILLRLGLLHALLSCSDHLGYAPWKARGFEFGDDMIRAVHRAFQSAAMEESQASNASRLWQLAHSFALQTYSASLQSFSEHLLLTCCVDLILSDIDSYDSDSMDAAKRTLPQIVHAMRELDAQAHRDDSSSDVLLLELSKSVWSKDNHVLAIDTGNNTSTIHHRWRLRGVVRDLRSVLEYRGFLTAAAWPPKTSPSTPMRAAAGGGGGANGRGTTLMPPLATSMVHATTLLLDTLTRFATELEKFTFDDRTMMVNFPCDYKRPLHQLLHHEVALLQRIQGELIEDMNHLQAVSVAGEAPNPMACEQFAELLRGDSPRSWCKYLLRSCDDRSHRSSISFETFQLVILDRLRFFHSWVEHGTPSRLGIDKFQSSIECILETIHHHFVRNLVGNMHCSGGSHCVRVARIYEDRVQITLAARDDTVFVSGWRLHGHLQLEIVSAVGNPSTSAAQSLSALVVDQTRKRPQTASKIPQDANEVPMAGTPVIIELTTSCLTAAHSNHATVGSLGSGSMRQLPLTSSGGGGGTTSDASSRRSSITASYDFRCPVVCSSTTLPFLPENGSAQTTSRSRAPDPVSVLISSALPTAQLVLSGSYLQITEISDLNDEIE